MHPESFAFCWLSHMQRRQAQVPEPRGTPQSMQSLQLQRRRDSSTALGPERVLRQPHLPPDSWASRGRGPGGRKQEVTRSPPPFLDQTKVPECGPGVTGDGWEFVSQVRCEQICIWEVIHCPGSVVAQPGQLSSVDLNHPQSSSQVKGQGQTGVVKDFCHKCKTALTPAIYKKLIEMDKQQHQSLSRYYYYYFLKGQLARRAQVQDILNGSYEKRPPSLSHKCIAR